MSQEEMLEELRKFLGGHLQGFTYDSGGYKDGTGGTAFMLFFRAGQGLRVEFTQKTLKEQTREQIISRLKRASFVLDRNVAFRVSEKTIDEIPWGSE